MKIHSQIISQNGKPAFVVLPYPEYCRIIELFEDLEDVQAAKIALAHPSECFPLAIVERIAKGESPIKVYREYRQLSQATLAKKASISRQYLFLLESGARKGSLRILKTIAQILAIDIEDLA